MKVTIRNLNLETIVEEDHEFGLFDVTLANGQRFTLSDKDGRLGDLNSNTLRTESFHVGQQAAQPTTPSRGQVQDRFMAVLAARHRAGHPRWTFERRHTETARDLQGLGLIGWKPCIAPNTISAWLTDAGREFTYLHTQTPMQKIKERNHA